MCLCVWCVCSVVVTMVYVCVCMVYRVGMCGHWRGYVFAHMEVQVYLLTDELSIYA